MNRIVMLLVAFVGMALSGASQNMTVEEVFEAVSEMDGFQGVDYKGEYGQFPNEIGTLKMIIHANARPREAVLELLGKLPEGALVYDYTDERGKFDRFFLDKSTYSLLYVHIGLGGNDSVVILFTGGVKAAIDDFLRQLNSDAKGNPSVGHDEINANYISWCFFCHKR